jgi:hypothetical protein
MSKEKKKKTCFIIAPIGDEGSNVRLRSDEVQRHLIEPAARDCGYDEIIRADNISEPGVITRQVIEHLLNDELVVADLADHNPNVFYELAIRHAVRKPVVLLIEKDQKIPFDVSQSRAIRYEYGRWSSLFTCKEELVKQITSCEKDPAGLDNPVSTAVDVMVLHQSKDPTARTDAEIISTIQEMKAMMISERTERELRSGTVWETRGFSGGKTYTPGPLMFRPPPPSLSEIKAMELFALLLKDRIDTELKAPNRTQSEIAALRAFREAFSTLFGPESTLGAILEGRPLTQEECDLAARVIGKYLQFLGKTDKKK